MNSTNNDSSSSSPDAPKTEDTPLTSEGEDSRDVGVVQELGGHSYCLNPARLNNKHDDKVTLTSASLKVAKLASFVVLSPLFVLGTACMYVAPRSIHNYLISRMLRKICGILDSTLRKERTILLRNISGRVLDLGSGSGQYLQYLSKASYIVALEPLKNLHPSIQREANKWLDTQHTKFELFDLTLEEYLEEYPTDRSSFDWILLGNVMCEVNDPIQTLQSVDRALKDPGGIVYFSEHVACSSRFQRRLQHVFNPFWRTLSGGCNINRDTLQNIEAMHNWRVISWEYPIRVGLGPFVLGLAQKDGPSK